MNTFNCYQSLNCMTQGAVTKLIIVSITKFQVRLSVETLNSQKESHKNVNKVSVMYESGKGFFRDP